METTMKNAFAKPHGVDFLDTVCGGNTDRLLPKMSDIPDEFKRSGGKWLTVVSDWFFHGLKDAKWTPKPGIDQSAALRHVKACIGSFQPQHEHKEAGCAYLLSLWFEDVTYQKAK